MGREAHMNKEKAKRYLRYWKPNRYGFTIMIGQVMIVLRCFKII